MFKDHLWVHVMHNEGALAALANVSSSVLSGEIIVGCAHGLAAWFGVIGWFDRVDSVSNPVDKLSLGKRDGLWGSVKIRCPPRLLATLDQCTW